VQPLCASEFLDRPLPAEDARALVAHLAADAGVAGERELDCSPWGGAYVRVPADATAFPHRSARVLVKHGAGVDPAAPAAEREAARTWLRASQEIAHPSGTGGAYANFPDDDLDEWDASYLGANRERLLALKRRCDPAGVLGPPRLV
jgi:FAD/FMN-containing dehydrogenase